MVEAEAAVVVVLTTKLLDRTGLQNQSDNEPVSCLEAGFLLASVYGRWRAFQIAASSSTARASARICGEIPVDAKTSATFSEE